MWLPVTAERCLLKRLRRTTGSMPIADMKLASAVASHDPKPALHGRSCKQEQDNGPVDLTNSAQPVTSLRLAAGPHTLLPFLRTRALNSPPSLATLRIVHRKSADLRSHPQLLKGAMFRSYGICRTQMLPASTTRFSSPRSAGDLPAMACTMSSSTRL